MFHFDEKYTAGYMANSFKTASARKITTKSMFAMFWNSSQPLLWSYCWVAITTTFSAMAAMIVISNLGCSTSSYTLRRNLFSGYILIGFAFIFRARTCV